MYLARDLKHDRDVAIKVLHPELAAVLGAERFLSEIRTTASLQHPHILPLFDSGEAGGQLFYVMPYVEGETLRGRLDRDTQLPVADAVQLAREVAGPPRVVVPTSTLDGMSDDYRNVRFTLIPGSRELYVNFNDRRARALVVLQNFEAFAARAR